MAVKVLYPALSEDEDDWERLLADEETIKLTDFGLAKLTMLPRLSLSDEPMGSGVCASPEQLTNARDVDVRTDVFSVGVVFYVLLTGRLPVGRWKLPSELVPGVPRAVDALVERATATDREERYASAKALREVLEEARTEPVERKEGKAKTTQRKTVEPVVVDWSDLDREVVLLRSFAGRSDGVSSVTFSVDGRFVLTGSGDNAAMLWGLE